MDNENAVSVASEQRRTVGIPFTGKADPRRWNGGKPRKPRIADAFWRIANAKLDGVDRTKLDELCEEVWQMAMAGNMRAAELIFDRMEGKAVQPVEDVTPDEPMTEEQRKTRIAELMARASNVIKPSGN